MYCENCGAKNNDKSRFCIQCGQELTGSDGMAKVVNSPKKKLRHMIMAVIALVLVVAIIVVTAFDLWPWSTGADKEVTVAQTEETDAIQVQEQTTANDEVVNLESFNLDSIAAQCPDCEAAIETYIAMLVACQDWTTSKEEIAALEQQKCAQMQHFCTAKGIYVEDIPYAYHGSYGLYTGYWIGAGPTGYGTYTGKVYDYNTITYTGDWGFGMPDGTGELYIENVYLTWDNMATIQGDWNMTYRGGMKNGMLDGKGSWSESYAEDGYMYYNVGKMRIYDEATYSQNQLNNWTEYVEYDMNTGEILGYGRMMTDESGAPQRERYEESDDLSPEMEKALSFALVVGVFGFTAYLTYSAFNIDYDYDTEASNESALAEAKRWQELDAAHKAEEAQRIEEKKAADKAWAGSQLDRLDRGEIPYYEKNRGLYEAMYYGN